MKDTDFRTLSFPKVLIQEEKCLGYDPDQCDEQEGVL